MKMKAKLLLFAIIMALFTAKTATALKVMNDTTLYPFCLDNSDCRELPGHVCFLYFCYPWRTTSEAESVRPIKLCRRSRDCLDGERCVRHHDRRRVRNGVCAKRDEIEECEHHDDCVDLGGKCCANNYCCNEEYFQAMAELPCFSDIGCKVRVLMKIQSGN